MTAPAKTALEHAALYVRNIISDSSALPKYVSRRAREQLLHLLAEAAELEHNLLCSYLYAAFSLKRSTDEGVTTEELAAIGEWRKLILAVAREEMGHLLLVSNLFVALGARPHWNRPNFPVAPGYHPADIVVALTPFDQETLDHFIYLERPEGVALPDAPSFAPAADYARSPRANALMPGAHDYSTIGEFYGSLRECLKEVVAGIGERELFTGDPAMQIGPDVVSMPGVAIVTDLESALRVLDTIIVQGEGAPAVAEDSHYERFRTIRDDYERLLEARPDFVPARAAAANPVMRAPHDEGERVHVTHPAAAAVLDLANALYNHMLRLLTQAFGRSNPKIEAQRRLLDAAITVMGMFSAVSEYLTTLAADDSDGDARAGVSFTTLRATEPLVEDSGEWALLGQRFEELADGVRAACPPDLRQLAGGLDELAAEFLNAHR